MKLQRGGTVLGLIIGVVIGLGVALAVAVYVTKTPVPFLNKGQSRTPEQDAAEEKKNKDWDPNAPLYGKDKAKANAPGANASRPEGITPATPTANTGGSPANANSAAKSGSKPEAVSADPLGDLVKAKSGNASDPFAYFVQVGAFRTPEDAESQRAKLSLNGVQAKVTEREQSGHPIYRVRVGPFDGRDEAEKIKGQIQASGYDASLVRVQR